MDPNSSEKNILIVVATEMEAAPLLNHLRLKEYLRLNIEVAITGPGMIATVYQCARIMNKKYDYAINIGIAGSFKREIPIGSVVNVLSDRFSEMGAESGNDFLSPSETGLVMEDEILVKESFLNKTTGNLVKVRAITVNTVHGNSSSIERVVAKFNPDIETMEGAAFFYVCGKEGIPCAQVRAISNIVEKRNKNNWNIPLAIENLHLTLMQILGEMDCGI